MFKKKYLTFKDVCIRTFLLSCDIWYSKDKINIFLIRCELVPSLSSLVVCNVWTSKPLCVNLLDEIRIIDSRIIVLMLRLMI